MNLNRAVALTDDILSQCKNAASCIPKPVCLLLIMEMNRLLNRQSTQEMEKIYWKKRRENSSIFSGRYDKYVNEQ